MWKVANISLSWPLRVHAKLLVSQHDLIAASRLPLSLIPDTSIATCRYPSTNLVSCPRLRSEFATAASKLLLTAVRRGAQSYWHYALRASVRTEAKHWRLRFGCSAEGLLLHISPLLSSNLVGVPQAQALAMGADPNFRSTLHVIEQISTILCCCIRSEHSGRPALSFAAQCALSLNVKLLMELDRRSPSHELRFFWRRIPPSLYNCFFLHVHRLMQSFHAYMHPQETCCCFAVHSSKANDGRSALHIAVATTLANVNFVGGKSFPPILVALL